jgi:glycosyltransferase involved in cell wall biosynthesis
MKFSIITPVTLDREDPDNKRMPRYEMFLRCANSVFGQTFQDFEWVIADDICNPPIEEILEGDERWFKPKGLNAKVIRLEEKSGRIIAQNRAMEASTGEWICLLDADDEYSTMYLEAINDAIRIYPEYKVFNFNHLIFDYDYKVHERKFINMEVQKNLPFPSGTVGQGSYVFHRSVFEDIGSIPELGMWDFSEKAFEEFPEIKPFFLKPGTENEYNSLGNPWGQDYYLFYKMTRKYKSKYLDTALYYVHPRWGHKWKDDPDYVVDPGKKPEVNPNNI